MGEWISQHPEFSTNLQKQITDNIVNPTVPVWGYISVYTQFLNSQYTLILLFGFKKVPFIDSFLVASDYQTYDNSMNFEWQRPSS